MASDDPRTPRSTAQVLPNVTQDLTSDLLPVCFAIGHEALAGGDDCDAEAAEDPRQSVALGIDTKPGLAYAANTGDRPLSLGRVLERDLKRSSWTTLVVVNREILDVSLALEDYGY